MTVLAPEGEKRYCHFYQYGMSMRAERAFAANGPAARRRNFFCRKRARPRRNPMTPSKIFKRRRIGIFDSAVFYFFHAKLSGVTVYKARKIL
jgi:hypothetical protein